MADGEGTSLTGSPGARLAVARTAAGMSTNEVAERLHLNLETLEALESGQLESLGASVYVRGHLKRYAELVHIPEGEIMSAYEAWSGRLAALPDLREVITAPAVRSGTRGFELKPAHALIGAIVLVMIALVWWAMRKPARVTASSAAAPAASAPAAPLSTTPVSAAPAPAAPAAVSLAPVSAAPSPVLAATPAASAAGGSPVRLVLNFSENSWIEIYGADGTQLFHGIARAGSQHHVSGSAPLRVFLGNPPAVTLEMNGRPVVLTGNPKPRRFSLDDVGHVVEVHAADGAAKAPSASSGTD
jgi:cytoskeleton protein RodZ